jgi:hypothetical protein
VDAIAPLFFWICITGALGVPVLISAKLFIYGASAAQCRWSFLFKAAIAFVLWVEVTVVLVIFWVLIGVRYFEEFASNPAAKWHPSPALLIVDVIYLLMGLGLVYWVWRKKAIELL